MLLKKWAMAVALGASLAAAGLVRAADEPAPNTGGLTFSGGADYVTDYYFRGYLQEDDGFIIQPYVQMGIKLMESDQVSITPFIGTWMSFHEEKTGADDSSGPDAFFEADFYGGIDIAFGDFKLTPLFTAYTYPNGAFETVYEAGLKLSYNDAETVGKAIGFALNPYVAAYYEVEDDNPGASEDGSWEIGIAPSFSFKAGSLPIGISVPVTVGMNLDDYYFEDDGSNEFWGFGSIGVAASVPLPIPTKFGSWSWSASITYINLFADSAEASNDGDSDDWIFKTGIAFSY